MAVQLNTTVSGTSSLSNNQAQSVFRSHLRTDAVVKMYGGSDANGYTFGETLALGHRLPFDWATSYKQEIEGAFSAVRVIAINRMDLAITFKSILGVTESGSVADTSYATTPRIGGTFYAQMAPANTVNGFVNTTWSGASTITVASAATAHQFSISDRIALSSVPRADGGTRPLLLTRAYLPGASTSPWVPSYSSSGSFAATSTMRNRLFQAYGGGGDYVAAPGTPVPSYGSSPIPGIELAHIISFNTPVLSVWGCGDSITHLPVTTSQSHYINSFGMRACAQVSTTTRPVVWANFGIAGAAGLKSLAFARQYLAGGCPAPSVLVVNPVSANDDSSNWATEGQAGLQRVRDLALDWLRLAREYSIPYVIWFPLLPRESMPLAGDTLRKQLNTEMAAIAASYNVAWLTFPGLANGASPELYTDIYDSGDGIHPNDLANDTILSNALASVLQGLVQ